jgi:hypothetical protein
MPLRDHFRPPVSKKQPWDALHGMWPAMIVQQLFHILPKGYAAAPLVHLVSSFEIDVAAYDEDDAKSLQAGNGNGGVAVAVAAPPLPTLTLRSELPEQEEYEVRLYDDREGRRLVAVIEIVSPANKDRPMSRKAFVAKVAALLQRDVCVSVVDVVTNRRANLYAELLELIERSDPGLGTRPPAIYAVTIRGRKRIRKPPLVDIWFYHMKVGQPLPTLPVWLDVDLAVMLNLEPGYEEACRLLHID